ncbi:MAG: hypothetical protein U1G07_19985 [Verrucomicrobiota bacterium]
MKAFSLSIVAALFSASGVDCIAGTIYGITFFGNELISIDQSTGSGALVGSLGATVSAFGIAERGGVLYTFNPNTSQIQSIDPATGLAGPGFNIGVGGVKGEGDLAFRADGAGFLAAAFDANLNPVNDLYRFDLASGTSVRLGTTGITIDGLVFDGAMLYALGQGEGKLFSVDPSTGATTSIGSLGVDQNSPVAGLTLANDGSLLGAIDDRLYRIDKTTGAASPVDPSILDIGFSSVSGLAAGSPTGSSVPDGGSTIALLIASLAGLTGAASAVRDKARQNL